MAHWTRRTSVLTIVASTVAVGVVSLNVNNSAAAPRGGDTTVFSFLHKCNLRAWCSYDPCNGSPGNCEMCTASPLLKSETCQITHIIEDTCSHTYWAAHCGTKQQGLCGEFMGVYICVTVPGKDDPDCPGYTCVDNQ